MTENRSTARRLPAQLDPHTSARLFEAVEQLRRERGLNRRELADKVNLSQDVLNTWAYKARHEMPLQIDLDKALNLLAAVGHADSQVDELWWQLSEALGDLVQQAVGAAQTARALAAEQEVAA